MPDLLPTAPARRVTLRLPEFLPWQLGVARSTARFKVICLGRQGGKSTLAELLCLLQAQAPRSFTWYHGPTFPDVGIQWRELRAMIPDGFPGEFREAERRFLLPNGAEIAFKSANVGERRLRGGPRHLVIFDEAASIPDLMGIWERAARPSLTRYQGRAVFIGTPRGCNDFHTLFQRGLDPEYPEWQSWCLPSSVNPYLPPEELEQARRELPDRVFRQEYLAEFITDGAVFENLGDYDQGGCVCKDPAAQAPGTGPVVVGVDWGKHEDFTVFVALRAGGDVWPVLAVERSNQVDYVVQRERLAAFAQRHGATQILAEQNSIGEPIIEELQRSGLPVRGFQTTATSKPRIIDQLALAFSQRTILLPQNPVLLAELRSYTMARRAHGWAYGAPTGMHDDTVMALALAREAGSFCGYEIGVV